MEHKLFIRNIIIGVSLLSTTSISNAMADNVEEAAAKVLQGFKFAKPQPAVQAPEPIAPTVAPIAQAPAKAAAPSAAPEASAADVQETAPPTTLTLEADGSGIPADLAGEDLEASAGTGDEGTGNGSMNAAA